MVANVGDLDRSLRIFVGVSIVAVADFSPGSLHWIAVLGLVLVTSAFARFCPAYWLLGIKTTGHERA